MLLTVCAVLLVACGDMETIDDAEGPAPALEGRTELERLEGEPALPAQAPDAGLAPVTPTVTPDAGAEAPMAAPDAAMAPVSPVPGPVLVEPPPGPVTPVQATLWFDGRSFALSNMPGLWWAHRLTLHVDEGGTTGTVERYDQVNARALPAGTLKLRDGSWYFMIGRELYTLFLHEDGTSYATVYIEYQPAPGSTWVRSSGRARLAEIVTK